MASKDYKHYPRLSFMKENLIRRKQRRLFMEKDSHIVYMLRCSDDTLYTGYTTDLARRVQMHEEGKGAKYTRGRGPFRVVYIEKYDTKEEIGRASCREREENRGAR